MPAAAAASEPQAPLPALDVVVRAPDAPEEAPAVAAEVAAHQAAPTRHAFVIAHEDDDLLFLNPNVSRAVTAGTPTLTIYLTAGDAGLGPAYWRGREKGVRAAYAQMAGKENVWVGSRRTVQGHYVWVDSLRDAPQVVLAFFRLPDGNGEGQGFPATSKKSLERLWSGKDASLHGVADKTPWSKLELQQVLVDLWSQFDVSHIETTNPEAAQDHSDHRYAALFTRAAHERYETAHKFRAYRGYDMSDSAPNLSPVEHAGKLSAFLTYAAHDTAIDPQRIPAAYLDYTWRHYESR